jgi:hypothetical protein
LHIKTTALHARKREKIPNDMIKNKRFITATILAISLAGIIPNAFGGATGNWAVVAAVGVPREISVSCSGTSPAITTAPDWLNAGVIKMAENNTVITSSAILLTRE